MSTPAIKAPSEASFSSRLRSPAVAARIGLWLGICFAVAFVTGVISHYAQIARPPVAIPTWPAWGYRVNQGLHVASGTAAIPLLLFKLWAVYPKLFAAIPRTVRTGLVTALERGSIGVLVAASIFQLATGLANTAQWYPWDFSFRSSHYALAWIAIGALAVHVAVKLPVIRAALGSPLESSELDRPSATEPGAVSRRTLLRTAWLSAGVAVVLSAGATVPGLRRLSVFAVRTGEGPQGLPVNRTAAAAAVDPDAVGDSYRLVVRHGDRVVELSRDDLLAMTQRTVDLPIACVEGWSADATWTGVSVRDLVELVGGSAGSGRRDVAVRSLQRRGGYRQSVLPASYAEHDDTLLALSVNGETLSADHGYPARIIAPNRPGVLQTKWVNELEVLA